MALKDVNLNPRQLFQSTIEKLKIQSVVQRLNFGEFFDNSNNYLLSALLLCFMATQLSQLLFFAPFPEIGGDAVFKWEFAKALINGDPLDKFFRGDGISHHIMRWMSWVPALGFVVVFGDNVTGYYTSTFIPAVAAGIILLFLVHRYTNLLLAALCALLLVLDPQMSRATFQMLPTGAGLLPLATILLLAHLKLNHMIGKHIFLVFLSIAIFCFYGAKETNLFFIPGLAFILFRWFGLWTTLSVIAFGALLYGLEIMMLKALLGDKFSYLGRIYHLVSGEHFAGMTTIESPYWDAGIFTRWVEVPSGQKVLNLLFFASFIVMFSPLAAKWLKSLDANKQHFTNFIVLIGLSFSFFTTFFVVSIDPIRVGQPLNSRFLAILLPIAYLVLFIALNQLKVTKLRQIYIAIILSLTLANLHINNRPNQLHLTLAKWNTHFTQLALNMPDTICVNSYDSKKWIDEKLWYFPNSARNENFATIENTRFEKREPLWIRGKSDDCDPRAYDIKYGFIE